MAPTKTHKFDSDAMKDHSNVPPAFVIKASPGKGLGMFATQDLSEGHVVFTEKPIMKIGVAEFSKSVLVERFNELSAEQQKAYKSLSSVYGQPPLPLDDLSFNSRNPALNAITVMMSPNLFEVRTAPRASLSSIFNLNWQTAEAGEMAIGLLSSRINHSCLPNAICMYDKPTSLMYTTILKPVKAGEEIYYSGIHDEYKLWPVERRRAYLKAFEAFECDCAACGDASDSRSFAAESIWRRATIARLQPSTTNCDDNQNPTPKMWQKVYDHCLIAMKLLLEEGLVNMHLQHTSNFLTEHDASRGHWAGVLEYGPIAAKTSLAFWGDDDERVKKLNGLVKKARVMLAKK